MARQRLKKIQLLAKDSDDISVMSSLMQDAILYPGDVMWHPKDQQFVMVVNRFCWEEDNPDLGAQSRTHSAFRVDYVRAVKKRGIEKCGDLDYLNLLALQLLQADDKQILLLNFSSGRAIRLEIEKVAAVLQDLGESWPAENRPVHQKA